MIDAFLTHWAKQFPPFSLIGKVTSKIDLARQTTLHCYKFKMDHPVLVPSNNGNGNQQNHNQTCTKQPPATTR